MPQSVIRFKKFSNFKLAVRQEGILLNFLNWIIDWGISVIWVEIISIASNIFNRIHTSSNDTNIFSFLHCCSFNRFKTLSKFKLAFLNSEDFLVLFSSESSFMFCNAFCQDKKDAICCFCSYTFFSCLSRIRCAANVKENCLFWNAKRTQCNCFLK